MPRWPRRTAPPASPSPTRTSLRPRSSRRSIDDPHPVRAGQEPARRARPRLEHVRPPGLQHREPRRRADGAPGRLADHAAGRLLDTLARADRQADAQARQRPARERAGAGAGDRARAGADQGLGAARPPRGAARPRRRLQRAGGRPRPGLDRVRGRRPARGARGLRGARPPARPQGARPHGPHRPRARLGEEEPRPAARSPQVTSRERNLPMSKVIRDGDLSRLSGKVAVLGYGSQGHAHALNLHDSGADVVVGLREGSSSWPVAEEAGLAVATTAEAVRGAQLVSNLLPDQVQPEVYERDVAPNLAPGAALLFAHGINVVYGRIDAPAGHDVIMVAPKRPGNIVRR